MMTAVGQPAAAPSPTDRLRSVSHPRLPENYLTTQPRLAIVPDDTGPVTLLPWSGREPPADPAALAAWWASLARIFDDVFLAPSPSPTTPPSFDAYLSWRDLPPDTSPATRLHAMARLRNWGLAGWRRWGAVLNHGWKAGNFEARKRSIFGQDWLEAQPLKEDPAQRR
jgi:hypothetical protein